VSRFALIIALSLLTGCARPSTKQPPAPRDLATAQQPWDGEYVMRDDAGEVVQRSVWKDHKLVSAWELSHTSPGEWKQVAKDGAGVIKVYDRGKHAGFNWFEKGEIVRGAG
jgi:hypothetical protein